MKFIHLADMHFDTAFSLLSSKSDFGNIRRLEQRNVFNKVIDYIKVNNIPYLFIAGDLYEQTYIRQTTIEFINNLFKTIPNTKIFIAPGNHDPYFKNSFYNTFNWSNNVHIFNSNIEKIETEDANIYGYGFSDFYCSNSPIDKIDMLDKSKLNILVIHGTLDGSTQTDLQYNPMSSKKLNDLGFDYIALGHIHKTNYYDTKYKNIIYPGSTISLGFDEPGEHGVIDGNLTKDNLDLNFITLDNKRFIEKNVDISNVNSEEDLVELLNNFDIDENNLYKIILTGTNNFEINIYNIFKLISNEHILKIKDNTHTSLNLEEISKENTLKGLFVKNMLKKLDDESNNKEEILKAIEIGLDVL